MKVVGLPLVLLFVAAVLIAISVVCGALEIHMAAVLVTNFVLVGVTLIYVSLTGGILRQSEKTGLTVKGLAARTAAVAQAVNRHVEVARDTLSYRQAPVLVLRVLREVSPQDEEIPVQVQNVGEGAAIWPKVILHQSEPPDNLLGDKPPHILPPQQFERDVPPDQHVAVPKPTANSTKIRLECDDPRTGETISRVWLLYPLDEGRVEWCARLVREGED